MEQQQGLRRRVSHILTSTISICRSKAVIESPVCVPRPSRERHKPCLADLFSADCDTTPKTWSTSHLSPFDYKTCDGELDEAALLDKVTSFQEDYYKKPSFRGKQQQQQCKSSDSILPVTNMTSEFDPPTDSDIASSLLLELLQSQQQQPFEESVCSNELGMNNTKNDKTEKHSTKPGTRRRRGRQRSRGKQQIRSDEVGSGGSVAVAKRSVDPYEDFKRSMLEMIVEKEIFGSEDLEELLMSFLGLNSPNHHKVIVLVFVDVLHFLFSNSSPTTCLKS